MKHVSILAALVATSMPAPAATAAQPSAKDRDEPLLPTLVKKSKMRVGWVTGGSGPKHRSKQERNRRKAARRARARNTKR